MKSLLLAACLAITAGCATKPASNAAADYAGAVSSIRGTVLDEASADAAMARFSEFFGNVTAGNATKLIPRLYAPDAYFNDTLKTLHGSEAITAYFVKTAGHAELIHAEITDIARSGENYYLRWTMDVRFKGSKETIRTIGMTHLRFAPDGRIVLHQDFWDSTAGFFEHIPLLGPAIRWIKSQI